MEHTSIPYMLVPSAPSEVSPIVLDPILHINTPNVVFNPTNEFKHFVGPERLTKKGFLSYHDILERTYKYAKSNKLLTPNQRGFYLDSTLTSILKTSSVMIEWSDLYNHAMMLMPIVV